MSNARNLADLLVPGENTLQTVAIETDRIILNGTDGSASNAGDDLLLDASAASTDVGERFTYENGTDDGSAVLSGGDLKFDNVELLMHQKSLMKSPIGDGTTNIAQGLTKVWCRFDGTGTAAIGDSFNTTSITDHSTGLYTVTYANDLANANHSPHVTSGVNGATWGLQQNDAITAGSHKFILMAPNGDATDNSVVPTSSNGDLA